MKFLRIWVIATLLGAASPALAENWVTVAEAPSVRMRIAVDVDSIRREGDGLVYFQSDGGGRLDKAVDCIKRIQHSIRLYYGAEVHEFPDWRKHGGHITEGGLEAAALDFACARAQ
jgi:hypothetical protein